MTWMFPKTTQPGTKCSQIINTRYENTIYKNRNVGK